MYATAADSFFFSRRFPPSENERLLFKMNLRVLFFGMNLNFYSAMCYFFLRLNTFAFYYNASVRKIKAFNLNSNHLLNFDFH